MNRIIGKSVGIGILVAVLFMILASCALKEEKNRTTGIHNDEALLEELRSSLMVLVETWYPKTVDTIEGGFYADFNYKWEAEGAQSKFLVTQARHLWTTSTLYQHYKEPQYLDLAQHAFEYLSRRMQDSIYGGFHTNLVLKNGVYTPVGNTKSAYANAFAIYGLATYFHISGDTAALNLAKKTFYWLDQNAYDPLHKGYFDVLQKDGKNMLDIKVNDKDYENWVRKDWKDQNSSIHLMEAFSALYAVWPEEYLGKKLRELQLVIRDIITTDRGYLNLHLERDWTPVIFKDSSASFREANFWFDHVSFGHDVETGFLLLETTHSLTLPKDSVTEIKAKKMIDHGIAKGWDKSKGGFFEGGYYLDETDECTILNPSKIWWTQAEGLNVLMLMASLYPKDPRYKELFLKQWSYINKELVDSEYGGWYEEGIEGKEEIRRRPKAHNWKVNYHNIRALINCISMLEGSYSLIENE